MSKLLKFLIRELSILGCVFGFLFPNSLFASEKPNIIFFLVDDMGWMDCSVYGSKYYETPNIDRLAAMGKVFTSAYTASPLCSPTRASILTGRYPERFGLTTPAGHLPPNPDEILLAKNAAGWKKMVDPKSRTFMPLAGNHPCRVTERSRLYNGPHREMASGIPGFLAGTPGI